MQEHHTLGIYRIIMCFVSDAAAAARCWKEERIRKRLIPIMR